MEKTFAQLQKDGKTDVDNLVKWMKDSKVIDESKNQEEKARTYFNELPDKKNVTLEQFKEIINKLAAEFKNSSEGIMKLLTDNSPKALQDAIGGAASTLTGVLKMGAKVIDKTKEQEEKVRGYFHDVVDKKNVSLEQFKEVIKKIADEFKINLDAVTKKLTECGPKLLQTAVGGATSTLTGFMKDLVPKK